MNLAKLALPIAGSAALAVLLGIHLARPSASNLLMKAKADATPANSQTHDASPAFISSPEAAKTRQAGPQDALPSTPLLQNSNKLGLRPEDLKDARARAVEIAADMDRRKAVAANPAYYNQSMNTHEISRRLALRLRLDADATKHLEDVFSAYRDDRSAKLMESERKRIEREIQLLDADRESYVDYLTLQSMVSRGDTLSQEQEAFYANFRSRMESAAAHSDIAQWYQNSAVIDALGQQLSAEQRAGLTTFVEEQTRRDSEAKTMQAYMRSGAIAEKLGLSEAERSTLYEYFQDHPNASRAELAKLIAPELRELLPEGM